MGENDTVPVISSVVNTTDQAGSAINMTAGLNNFVRDVVEQVVAFGNSLHVSGHDAAALAASVRPFQDASSQAQAGREWKLIRTSLEEVFIHLMRGHQARQNGQTQNIQTGQKSQTDQKNQAARNQTDQKNPTGVKP